MNSPTKPGSSVLRTPSGLVSEVKQPENPKEQSKNEIERIIEVLPPGVPIKITERASATVGGAQKNTAQEVAAKLSSLKGVVWVGLLLFVFGAVSAVYPPLKVLVGGSVTTSAVCALAGLALIILPSVVVGHEVLIMCIGVGAAALWFFAHRNGHHKGRLTELERK